MGSLPWQVMYGRWIGWTAAAVLVVVGCTLYWLWIRWVTRRQAKRILAEFHGATTRIEEDTIEEGPVVLRGRIEVPGAPVPALDGSGAAAACTVEASSESLRFAPHETGARKCFRAPNLRLVTEGEVTTLRGAVVVSLGSREMFPGQLTTLDTDDRERLLSEPDNVSSFGTREWPKGLKVAGMIRTLRHGDEVVLRGEVQRHIENDGPGASYRPTDTALQVVAPKGVSAIEVAACRPGALSFGKRALLARGMAVGLALSIAVGIAAGVAAKRVDAFATASLFPQQRAWAIDELATEAALGAPSKARLERVWSYEEHAPNCRRTGMALLAHNQWQEAADMLAGCHDPELKQQAVTAYVMAGRLDKACELQRLHPQQNVELAVLLALGGCLSDAAGMLRKKSGVPEQSDTTRECLADALDGLTGNVQAMKRLASRGTETCRLAHASLLEGEERRKALAFLVEAPAAERTRHQHPFLTTVLLGSVTSDLEEVELPTLPLASRFISDPDGALAGRAHALELEVLSKLSPKQNPTVRQRALRRALAIRAAAFQILAVDIKAAQSLLDDAEADNNALAGLHSTTEAWINHARAGAQIASLRVLGHLLNGDTDSASLVLEPWVDLSPSRFLDNHEPNHKLPGAMETIRTQVARPMEDARALISAARGKTPTGKTVDIQTAAYLLGDTFLDIGNTRYANVLDVAAPQPMVGLALLAFRPEQEDRRSIESWLTFEARVPSQRPMTLMLNAALVAHNSQQVAPDAAKKARQAAQAYRAALTRPEVAMLLALIPSR